MSGTKIIIRPWSAFLATGDVSVPKRADVLSERIRLNLNHWLGNYLCIVAAFVVIAGYFYPGLFVASVLAAIGGAATIFTKDMRLEVGGMVINELHKYAVTAVVALFSLYWSESFQPLFVTVAIAGVLVLVHAAGKDKASLSTRVKTGLDSVKSDIKAELKNH
jgi:hypothetical protein